MRIFSKNLRSISLVPKHFLFIPLLFIVAIVLMIFTFSPGKQNLLLASNLISPKQLNFQTLDATPSPTLTPTATPTATPTPTIAPTATPTVIPSPTPTSTSAPTPTPTPDTTVPQVSITSPANNSSVNRGSTLVITANATDNVGVAQVQFYVNNTLTCTDSSAPYTCSWVVPSGKKATYSLSAIATDTSGNNATSSMVSVTSK